MVRLTEAQAKQQERDFNHEIQKLVSDVVSKQKFGGFDGSRLTVIADRLRELTEEFDGPTNVVGVDRLKVAHKKLMSGISDRFNHDERVAPLQKQLKYNLLKDALTSGHLRDKSV